MSAVRPASLLSTLASSGGRLPGCMHRRSRLVYKVCGVLLGGRPNTDARARRPSAPCWLSVTFACYMPVAVLGYLALGNAAPDNVVLVGSGAKPHPQRLHALCE